MPESSTSEVVRSPAHSPYSKPANMSREFRGFALLSWQILFLFVALGTLAPKLGGATLLCAGLLSLVSLLKIKRSKGRRFSLFRAMIPYLFYLAGLGVGWFAANLALNQPLPLPGWVDWAGDQPVLGRVEQVDGMPEGRLRIVLSDVRLASHIGAEQEAGLQNISEAGQPLPAKLAWTWMHPSAPAPLPGQLVRVNLRIREVRGMQNPGTFDIEGYWREKGVNFRAWTLAEKGEFELLAPAPFWHNAHAWVEKRMLAALLPEKAPGESESGGEPGHIQNGKAIIPALLMGNNYYLNTRQLDLFAAASLSHSLALSGQHLALMIAAGTGLAFGLCALRPQVMLRCPRPKLAVLFAAPLVLLYLWLGGLIPSLLRAALMFGCMALFLLRGRPHAIMDGLFCALLIMLLLDPLALYDLRLQLSATCIAAIGLALPWSLRISRAVFSGKGRLHSFLRGGMSLLLISLAIQLVLLPLQAWNFGQATPWFILNLIWLPVLSAWVFPFSVLGLLLSLIPGLEGAARTVFELAAMPGDGVFALLVWLDDMGLLAAPAVVRPALAASLAYWLLLLVLAILGVRLLGRSLRANRSRVPGLSSLSRRLRVSWSALFSENEPGLRAGRPILLVLAAAWLLTAYYLAERWRAEHPEGPRLTLIDVGQGQAVLFEGTAGERILVDGGGLWNSSFDIGKNVLGPALSFNRAPRLDAVVNTHPDSDHLGGLLYVIRKFEVRELFLGQGLPKGEYGEIVAQVLAKHGYTGDRAPALLRAGDKLALDRKHKLTVLHPPLEMSGGAEAEVIVRKTNSASLVMQLQSAEENLALACGDIDQAGIKALLGTVKGTPGLSLASIVLVLPHHGSKHGLNLDFYDAVNPETTVVSAGYANQWGFPAQAVREELARRKIPLYSTSDYGQIVIEWDSARDYTIKTVRVLP